MTFKSEDNNIARGEKFKAQGFEAVVPPVSVLAEFPVAGRGKGSPRKGTRKTAEAAKTNGLPEIRLINPQTVLGNWADIQKRHFGSSGVLDELLASGR